MKNLIIASTSTIYGGTYLDYLIPEISNLFKESNEIVFIPFAQPGGISYDEYTLIAKKIFAKIGINVKGIHEYKNAKEAIKNAKGLFVGGGNTFVLVNELYKQDLFNILRDKMENGMPYLGTSAGSNICGPSMQTTNDMPIVYPPSYKTLGVIPFNINAHYLDTDPNSKHKGETRETRIKEFHVFNSTPVLGLREGSWLDVNGDEIILKGTLKARFFEKNKLAVELDPITDLQTIAT
jgi:dipeptidase E